MRYFNTAGPCKPDIHYMLPVSSRLPDARRVIDQQAYFVIHAPRQVGKTTTMMELARELTAEGRYTALLVSMEVGAVFSNDPGAAELAVLGTWRGEAELWLNRELQPPPWLSSDAGQRIFTALKNWSMVSPRPLVLFLDGIDTLENDALISVLCQLRNGHRNRPQGFPSSLALIGMSDVRVTVEIIERAKEIR